MDITSEEKVIKPVASFLELLMRPNALQLEPSIFTLQHNGAPSWVEVMEICH